MSEEYKLTFNEGDPIDATKLQQLLKFINEVNSKAVKLPTGTDIAGDVVDAVMTIGKTDEYIELNFSGTAISERINFKKGLTNTPYAVIATLESPSDDLDIVHYIRNIDKNGFTILLNRVAGVDTAGGAAYTSSRGYRVRVHYFAIANPELQLTDQEYMLHFGVALEACQYAFNIK